MPIDTVIENGTIVRAAGREDAAIGIDDGEIVGLGRPERLPDAEERIDATGLHVLPGLINCHVHYREPGPTYKEDFTTGSMASAAGGYTMFMDMPNCDPITNTLERYEAKVALADEKAVIDHNSWAGATDPDDVEEIFEHAGNLGFKIFMHRHPEVEFPYVPELAVHDRGELYRLFRRFVSLNPDMPVSLHPSDVSLADELYEDLVEMGANDYKAIREGKDGMNMTLGAFEAAFLAKITGLSNLNLLHLGFNERTEDPYLDFADRETTVDLVARLKDDGWDFYGELEASTALARERDAEPDWKQRWYTPDNEKLWAALRDGVADMAVIEHAPHLAEEADADDAWDANSGLLGSQEFLPLMLTAVDEGKLSLERLVEVTARTPAEFLGIHPDKGSIRTGTDADLTIVDLDAEWTIDGEDTFAKAGWSSWDGYEVVGKPVRTVVRGETVYADGEIRVEPGFGEYVHRDEYQG
jgi:dihydroorotase